MHNMNIEVLMKDIFVNFTCMNWTPIFLPVCKMFEKQTKNTKLYTDD
jgi:hypothetical protein